MPTIDLFFAGLIAFAASGQGWTAYIVDDDAVCDHSAELVVLGSFEVLQNDDDLCDYRAGQFTCNLESVEVVSLAPLAGGQNFENGPGGVVPSNQQEGASEKWLVRMVNVHRPASRIKGGQALGSLVGARFGFNWDQVRSCHLEEGGLGNIRSHRFRDGALQTAHQAIAESMLFTANVAADSATLTLAWGQKRAALRLNCSTGTCPLILVKNTASRRCTEGHFEHYYRLSQGQFSGRPVPVEQGLPAVFESMGSDKCEKQLKLPLREHFRRSGIPRRVRFLARIRLLFELRKVQDRIVCPPVVFEAP